MHSGSPFGSLRVAIEKLSATAADSMHPEWGGEALAALVAAEEWLTAEWHERDFEPRSLQEFLGHTDEQHALWFKSGRFTAQEGR